MHHRLGPGFKFAQSEGQLVKHLRAGHVRRLPLLLAVAALCHADVASWIAAQGGTMERDRAGRVIGANLRAAWITDTDLSKLSGLPHLTQLNLARTHISDVGMERLAPIAGLAELDLGYAEHITDEGLAHLKSWRKL